MVLVASGFAVGAATLTARWMNRNAQPVPPKSEQPALIVDPAHLDFGEAWETEKFEWVEVRIAAETPRRSGGDAVTV